MRTERDPGSGTEARKVFDTSKRENMLSEKMQEAINAQINAELWSAYLYLSMSADAAAKGYKGVANWFHVQFREEQDHAQIFINYLLARGAKVMLQPLTEVTTSWESVAAMFRSTLEHEKEVTAMIHNLYALAGEERDPASLTMLGWFVDEQVEEEQNAADMIFLFEQVESDKLGKLIMDKELSARTYRLAAPLAAKD